MTADIVRFPERHRAGDRPSPLTPQPSKVIPFTAHTRGLTTADLSALRALMVQLGDGWFFEIQRDRTGERWALIGGCDHKGFIVCRNSGKLVLIDITEGESPKKAG
jgi:hypothetical protein